MLKFVCLKVLLHIIIINAIFIHFLAVKIEIWKLRLLLKLQTQGRLQHCRILQAIKMRGNESLSTIKYYFCFKEWIHDQSKFGPKCSNRYIMCAYQFSSTVMATAPLLYLFWFSFGFIKSDNIAFPSFSWGVATYKYMWRCFGKWN